MLNLVDKLILLYELTLTVHILLFNHNIANWVDHIQLNIIIFIWVFISAWSVKYFHRQPFKFIHTFYPLFLLAWHYPQACELRYSVIPMNLDSLFSKWDLILFRVPLYTVIPEKLNFVFSGNYFTFIYFSYYLMLGIPVWIVYKSRHPKIPEYIFVITLTCYYSSMAYHIDSREWSGAIKA